MTGARWIDRSPSVYAHRVVADLPRWFRWFLAWVGLLGAMVVAWMLLVVVLGTAVGLA